MKKQVAYWAVTALVALMMVGSGAAYLVGAPQMVEGFRHLGYPDYFRVVLGVAKVAGAGVLLVPFVPATLREWTYAGFAITLGSAAISHAAVGDPASRLAGPLVALALLLVSYGLHRSAPASRPGESLASGA